MEETPPDFVRALEQIRIGFNPDTFQWDGIRPTSYKFGLGDERGMGFRGVSRFTFGKSPALAAGFELRYFEFEPGGFSSIEKHEHVHLIIGIRGHGRALVGDQIYDVHPFDLIHVPANTPHRWVNESNEPFGYVCPVDSDRDRPQPLSDDEWERLRANPVTTEYVF